MNCKKLTVHSARVSENKLHLKTYHLPCNAWRCPECAKRKARHVARVTKKGFRGERIRFATLTLHASKDLTQSAKNIKEAWNRLRLVITRKFGPFKYVWAIEGHKRTGMPHMHLLVNIYIPQRWLSANADRCGFGYIADIREVRNESAFDYVVKYLGKGLGSRTLEKIMKENRLRRWSKSRSIKNEETTKSQFTTIRISDFINPDHFEGRFLVRSAIRANEKETEFDFTDYQAEAIVDIGNSGEYFQEVLRLYATKAIDVRELASLMKGKLLHYQPPKEGWEPWNELFLCS